MTLTYSRACGGFDAGRAVPVEKNQTCNRPRTLHELEGYLLQEAALSWLDQHPPTGHLFPVVLQEADKNDDGIR